MRHWFYERYEDPVNSQSHDSREGGYIFVNGGPFDAREELEAEFSPVVKQAVIDKLAKELEDECLYWTYTDSYDLELHPEDEDFYEIDAALDNQTPLVNLTHSLLRLRRLLAEKDKMDQSLHKFQLMMIYGFCITSLEAYLSDAFAKRVMNDTNLKKKYLAKFINKRHDFVHRGGKDTEGQEVTTTEREVEALIKAVEDFCAVIDAQIFLSDR
jgi:hypothetical protein